MGKKAALILILVFLVSPLFSVSDGEYSIKAGFAFDSITSEHLVIYEPTVAYEKSRFYNSGNVGTAFNLSVNFPVSYSVDNYFASPFTLFLSFDTSWSLALRYKALRYYIGPAFSFDAMLTDGYGIRVQFGLGVCQNLGFQFDIGKTAGLAGGVELYSNVFTGDFVDTDLSGFFNGWKFKARVYLAMTIAYSDGFHFGSGR